MKKKISLLTVLIMGLSLFLFACKPYSDLKLSVSETDVVLYLNKDAILPEEESSESDASDFELEEGENAETDFDIDETEPFSKVISATVSGAKKKTSREVRIEQTGYVVEVRNKELSGNTTTFELVAKNPGNSVVVISTREGNLKHTINITVHEKIESIEFVNEQTALAEGVSINLEKQITYLPKQTTQKDVGFFISDVEANVLERDEYGNAIETRYAKIENNNLVVKDMSLAPINQDTNRPYILVGAYSKHNRNIIAKEEKEFTIITIAKESDVSLFANNETDNVQLSKNSQGQYEVVIASGTNDQNLFNRKLTFKITDNTLIDRSYVVGYDKSYNDSKLVNIVNLTNYENRNQEFNNFQITKKGALGEDVVRFLVDYNSFMGQFTIPVYVKFVVKEIPSSIEARDKDNRILTENSVLEVFKEYPTGVQGAELRVFVRPDAINLSYTLTPIGTTLTVKTANGTVIPANQHIVSGQPVFLSHNLIDNLPENPKLEIVVSYSLATNTEQDVYEVYTKKFVLNLNYQIGLKESDLFVPQKMLIDSNNRQLIEGGERTKEIYFASITSNTINLVDEIDSIRFISFEGINVGMISDFNLDVNDNQYFRLEKDATANAVKIYPHSTGGSTTFRLAIRLTNGIEKFSEITIFSSIAYTLDNQAHVEMVGGENAYFDVTYNAFYVDFNETNDNLRIRQSQGYNGLEEVVHYNSEGEIIIANETENSTPLPETYKTLRSINMKTNSEIGLEFYNYIPVELDDELSVKKVSYNNHISINRYSYDHFTITRNSETNGIIIKTKSLSAHKQLTIPVIFSGYNEAGEGVRFEYEIKVKITEPISSIGITPAFSDVFEKTSLGALSQARSSVQLKTTINPVELRDELTQVYNMLNDTILSYEMRVNPDVFFEHNGESVRYIDYVMNYISNNPNVNYISANSNGVVLVEFYAEHDIATVSSDGVFQAELKESVQRKIDQIYRLTRTLGLDETITQSTRNSIQFRDISNRVYEEFYNANIRVRVLSTVRHFNQEPLTAQAEISINFAKKVQNIISTDIGAEGIYFDTRKETQTIREAGFYALPYDAHDGTLIATIGNPSVARIVAGVNELGEITGIGLDGKHTGKITIQMQGAGETYLRISAKDSYRETMVNGEIVLVPGTERYYDYRIKSADGSVQNPFEVRTVSEFLEIKNLPNKNYVLANNISLANINYEPIKNFGGSLSGEFTYYSSGIYYTRYNSIVGLNITSSFDVENNANGEYSDYNVGLFENLKATAKITNLEIRNADVNVNFNKITSDNQNTEFNKSLNVGVVAGESLATISNVVVNANINVVAGGTKNINIGGIVGVQQATYNKQTNSVDGALAFNNNSQFSAINDNSVVNIKLKSDKHTPNITRKNIGGIVGLLSVLGENTALVQEAHQASALSGFNATVIVESLYDDEQNNRLNSSNVGGIVGEANNAYLENLQVVPTLRAYSNVGGVVGFASNSAMFNNKVNMFSTQLTGLNQSAIVAANNVGGLVGVASGLKISHSQVRSFVGTSVGEDFLGDIVLVNGVSDETGARNVGGLIGTVLSNGNETSLYYVNGEIVELPHNEGYSDSLVYERLAYTNIHNSYFDATINAGYENISAGINAGGLVGVAVEEQEQEFATLSISNSYVVGNVLMGNHLPETPEVLWLDVDADEESENHNFKARFFNPVVEVEIIDMRYITFGEFVFKEAFKTEQKTNQIATHNINILNEFKQNEDSNKWQFKVVITTTYENVAGLIVGNAGLQVNYTTTEYGGIGEPTTYEDEFEIYPQYQREGGFEISQQIGNNILVEFVYGSINTHNSTIAQVGVVVNKEITIRKETFFESYIIGQEIEEIEGVLSADHVISGREYEFESLSADNLKNNHNFYIGEYSISLYDEDGAELEKIKSNEFPLIENYPAAVSLSFEYDNNQAVWFVYSGINNGLPVLIAASQNQLLYDLLPSEILANVVEFNDNDVEFNNSSYVKVSNNKVVLFNNRLVSGQGMLPSSLNKYRVVRKGTTPNSNNIYDIIEYDFNLNTPNNLPFQPSIRDRVNITSSNPSIIRVLQGGIVEALSNGFATLTISSVVSPSISTSIDVLVVHGFNSYKIIGQSSQLNTDIYIDQFKNYTIETLNNISISTFVGQFQKNNNVGFVLSASYDNEGLIELNGIELQPNKEYVFENIKEFNLKGLAEGVARFNITPFIKVSQAGFGDTVEGENKTVNNVIKLSGLKIDENINNLSFNIIPKALMISTNNTTNAKISPTNTTQVKVSFITSAFNVDAYNSFIDSNAEGININNLADFMSSNALKEEISVLVKNSHTNTNLFRINNVLKGIDSSVHTFASNEKSLILLEVVNISVAEIVNSSNEIKQLEIDFVLELSFDKEEYSENARAYNLNQQNYGLTFMPSTNKDISAHYNLEITPNKTNRITTSFYAGSEYENQGGDRVFNPKETSSNYIAPGRTGLLKMYIFPEFNDAEYVELTANDAVKDFVSFEQLLEVYDDESGFGNVTGYSKLGEYPNKLPNNKGIVLKNTSILTFNNLEKFNGSFFAQVRLDAGVSVGEVVEFTITAYKTTSGTPEAIISQKLSLNVQPLPNVSITYNNSKEGIAVLGSTLELDVQGYNYDGDIGVEIVSSTPHTRIDIVEGKHYLVIGDNANIGDTIRVKAVATKLINGIDEDDDDEIIIRIVDFIINNVQLSGASSQSASANAFEILNGTNNELSVVLNAEYSQTAQYGQLIARKQYLESVIAGKELTASGLIVNNWVRVDADGTTHNLNVGTTYDETFMFRHVTTTGINMRSYYSLLGLRVSNGEHMLGVQFSYYYDSYGRVQVYTGRESGVQVYETLIYTFRLIINDNSTYDHPNPVSTEEEFYGMQEGVHYILINDITLNNHTPFIANFASLDGNGYVINLNSFNMTQYANAGAVVTGMFESVGENTVVKNITLNIAGLLLSDNEVKQIKDNQQSTETSNIDLRFIENVVFGVFAGDNRGTLTNIKVVNLGREGNQNPDDKDDKNILNKQLFVNTTQYYINGREMIAQIGGVVGYNSGTISNSFVGQNYHYITTKPTGQNAEGDEQTFAEGTSKIQRVLNNNQIQEQNTYNFVLSGGKRIAGFAYQNSGTIANSYVKEVGIINQSEVATNSQTGGFVLNNTGRIYGSFIEGKNVTNFTATNEIYIEAKGFIGGFVYSNNGTITDSYSNITITSNSGRSGGFVYTNLALGTIKNAYSAGNSGARAQTQLPGQMSAHGYFTGISDVSEYNNTGRMTSVFYLLLDNDMPSLGEPATPIKAGLAGGTEGNTFRLSGSFSEFSFVSENQSNDGIWKIDSANPNYGPQLVNTINTNTLSVRYGQESELENVYNYTYDDQTPYGSENNPILVNTAEEFLNAVLSNTKTYYSDSVVGQRKYIFGETAAQNAYIKLVNDLDFSDVVINEFVVRGIRISDVAFAGHLDGNGMSMYGISLLDLNKSEVNENYGLFNQIGLSDSHFKEFTRKNISDKSTVTTVKDINIYIRQFDATQSVKVGTLAGSIYDANLINVSINGGSGVIISGRNIVGGVAGLMKYESEEHTITGLTVNNVSVSASFSYQKISTNDLVNDYGQVVKKQGANEQELQFYSYQRDMDSSENQNRVSLSQMQRYSYAGGVAGVFDGINRSEENKNIATENVEPEYDEDDNIINKDEIINDINKHRSETISKFNNITSVGGGVVSAEQAGGLFGMVGRDSHIMNSSYIVNSSQNTAQMISGYNYAGGIVAENYGMLEKVFIEHEAESQESYDQIISRGNTNIVGKQNLFGTNPNVAIGGIAGYTDNSIILDSYVKVNVSNAESKIAGGIVGLVSRQNYISHVFITSNVFAKNVYGGAFGLYNNSGQNLFKNVVNNATLVLDYVVALNTWSTAVENDVKNNLQGLYSNSDHYIRMAEVGNLQPIFTKKDKVNIGDDLTALTDEQTEIDRYNSITNRIIQVEHNFKFIGSVIGKVSLSKSVLTSSETSKNHEVYGGVVFLNQKGVNHAMPKSREISDDISSSKRSVISTTLSSSEVKLSNDKKTGLWATTTHPNLKGDILSYDNVLGEQYKVPRIVGLESQYINTFAQWEIDNIAIGDASSHSKRWRISEVVAEDGILQVGVLPEYIVGVYSNYTLISTNDELKKLMESTASTKYQYYVLEYGSYDLTVDNSLYASDNAFEGMLIGVPNSEGENPQINFVVSSGTETIRPNTIFKSIDRAIISNIDFNITLKTASNNTFVVNNSQTLNTAESQNFGFITREILHSTISNVNININSETDVEIEINGGEINNFSLAIGWANNSTINTVNMFVNSNIVLSANSNSNGEFAIAPLIAKSTDTDLTSVNIFANKHDFKVNANNISGITKLFVGGVVAKVETINKNQTFRNINTVNTEVENINEIDLDKSSISLVVENPASATQVFVGGIISQADTISIVNAYYFGNIVVGDDEDYAQQNVYVGGIAGNITASSDMQSVFVNSYMKLNKETQTAVVNKLDGELYSITVHAKTNTYVGGIVGSGQNTSIISGLLTGSSNNSSNIFVHNYSETTLSSFRVYVGGIAGYLANTVQSKLANLYNAGEINVSSHESQLATYVGGLVGYSQRISINNVYSYGNILLETQKQSTNHFVGGLVGQVNNNHVLENFMVFADVYLTIKDSTHNNPSILAGGVFGRSADLISSIKIGNGVALARLFVNDIAGVKPENISPIGHNANVNQSEKTNTYFVHEFYAHTNYAHGTPISYDALKVLINASSHNNIMPGLTSIKLSGTQKLGDGFNYDSLGDAQIKLPNISNMPTYASVDAGLGSRLTKEGGKLNPITIITADDMSSINESDLYYVLPNSITFSAVISEFNGFLYSSAEAPAQITRNSRNSLITENNGIISNLLIENNNYLSSNQAYLTSQNNGLINNVITYGHVPNDTANRLIAGLAFTNSGVIVNSANATVFTGAITGESTYSGLVHNNRSYAVINNSYANTLLLNENSNVKLSGLVHENENNATISNAYFAGTIVNAENWNGLVNADRGRTNNIIYDANNINVASNSQGKRTEHIKNRHGWIAEKTGDYLKTQAFVVNSNNAINYGYPIIINGIKLPTNVRLSFTTDSFENENYKKVSDIKYFYSDVANIGYVPVYSAGMLTTTNYTESSAVLVANINFENYNKTNDDTLAKVYGLGNLNGSIEFIGNDLQIANFNTTSTGLFSNVFGKISRLTIKNGIINSNGSSVGTLAGAAGATVELTNITILNPNVNGGFSVGGVVGGVEVNNNTKINTIKVKLEETKTDNTKYGVVGGGDYIGGVFGSVKYPVQNATTTKEVIQNITAKNISIMSSVQGASNIGGVVGYVQGIILNTATAINLNINNTSVEFETGSRISLNPYSSIFNVGGIAGFARETELNNVKVDNVEISGEDYLGGIVGNAIKSSINTGLTLTGVKILPTKKTSINFENTFNTGEYKVGDLFDMLGITSDNFRDNAETFEEILDISKTVNQTTSGKYSYGLISGNQVTVDAGAEVKIDSLSKIENAAIVTLKSIKMSITPMFDPKGIGVWEGSITIDMWSRKYNGDTKNRYGMQDVIIFDEGDINLIGEPISETVLYGVELGKLGYWESLRNYLNSYRYHTKIFNAFSSKKVLITSNSIKQV